jgi:hypothetical protein
VEVGSVLSVDSPDPIKMKASPKVEIPSHVPGAAIVRFTGITAPNLSNKVAAGVAPKPDGKIGYPFEATIRALFEELRKRADSVRDGKAVDAARLTKAEADRAEMKAAKEAGDVEDLAFVFNNAKAEIVKRICAKRYGAEVEKEIFGSISDALQGALDELENRKA